mmetsp:Transcript_24077/g.24536  ORF Transcript_24077/g.24536 Transcript_24077/m.24536 type:complete len:81 (+) Transcript_24077:1163-1405(+)
MVLRDLREKKSHLEYSLCSTGQRKLDINKALTDTVKICQHRVSKITIVYQNNRTIYMDMPRRIKKKVKTQPGKFVIILVK